MVEELPCCLVKLSKRLPSLFTCCAQVAEAMLLIFVWAYRVDVKHGRSDLTFLGIQSFGSASWSHGLIIEDGTCSFQDQGEVPIRIIVALTPVLVDLSKAGRSLAGRKGPVC